VPCVVTYVAAISECDKYQQHLPTLRRLRATQHHAIGPEVPAEPAGFYVGETRLKSAEMVRQYAAADCSVNNFEVIRRACISWRFRGAGAFGATARRARPATPTP